MSSAAFCSFGASSYLPRLFRVRAMLDDSLQSQGEDLEVQQGNIKGCLLLTKHLNMPAQDPKRSANDIAIA
jgi:hypothetical protein